TEPSSHPPLQERKYFSLDRLSLLVNGISLSDLLDQLHGFANADPKEFPRCTYPDSCECRMHGMLRSDAIGNDRVIDNFKIRRYTGGARQLTRTRIGGTARPPNLQHPRHMRVDENVDHATLRATCHHVASVRGLRRNSRRLV